MSQLNTPQLNRKPILPLIEPRFSPITRMIISVGGLIVVIALALILSRLASDPIRFPVTNVDVLGTLDYTDRAKLQVQIEQQTKDGFYGLDIDRIRRSVETLPWVAEARVSRIWPGRVSVEVEEHEPTARWNDDSLISKRLELFVPPQLDADNERYSEWLTVFSDLPLLSGADGRHTAVLDSFREYQRAFDALGVSIEVLSEDERHSQTLELSNQVLVRLGYEEHDLRLARFLDVYQRLVTPLDGRGARFDMRYSNGFAYSGARS